MIKPPSNIIPCRNVHIQYLCDRMRQDEREQYCILSCEDEYNADRAAAYFMTLPGHKFTALGNDGLPAAAGGYQEIYPGVWQSWMVGTEEGWKEQWRSITKGCRWLADFLFAHGARRLQTNCLAHRSQAIAWYTNGLKMRPEGLKKRYGRNGEDLAEFARVA